MPNFNYGRYIGDCLRSLDDQSSDSLEIIVIDDGSSDQSRQVIEEWARVTDRPNRIVMLPENHGAPHAFNVGLEMAIGEFVCFVDADDYVMPDKVAQQLAAFDSLNSGVGVVYHDHQIYAESTGRVSVSSYFQEQGATRGGPWSGSFRMPLLQYGSLWALCSAMIRRSAIDAVGHFDEDLVLCDLPLWLKLSKVTEAAYIDEPLCLVREHDQSMRHDPSVRLPLLESKLRVWSGVVAEYGRREQERRMAQAQGERLIKQLALNPDPAARRLADEWAANFGLRSYAIAILGRLTPGAAQRELRRRAIRRRSLRSNTM